MKFALGLTKIGELTLEDVERIKNELQGDR